MRYAAIRPFDISNGTGIGVALFTQGCSIRCRGCFQPETWDFKGGNKFTDNETKRILEYLRQPGIIRFTILGGEPLEECNLYALAKLIKQIKDKFPHLKIWLYTGYMPKQLQSRMRQSSIKFLNYILSNIDVLVAGPFIESQKDFGIKWCGSRNQQVIDMSATLKQTPNLENRWNIVLFDS